MDAWIPNWSEVFVPSKPLPEIFLRGTLVYLCLFLLLRFVLNRQTGNVSISDLLLTVLIADAVQNAMAAEYRSVPEGLLLVATLIFWDYALDWLSYHVPALRKLIHPAPLAIIHNGKLQYQNLRRELLTEEEVMSQLRKEGVEDPRLVKDAFLEGNGRLSVIEQEEGEGTVELPARGAEGELEKELTALIDAARSLHRRMKEHRPRLRKRRRNSSRSADGPPRPKKKAAESKDASAQ